MKTKIRLGEAETVVKHEDDKIINITGDETLVRILKGLFSASIAVLLGGYKEDKKFEAISNIVTLKPGDKGYIKSVLLERVRNEFEMEIS